MFCGEKKIAKIMLYGGKNPRKLCFMTKKIFSINQRFSNLKRGAAFDSDFEGFLHDCFSV